MITTNDAIPAADTLARLTHQAEQLAAAVRSNPWDAAILRIVAAFLDVRRDARDEVRQALDHVLTPKEP